MAGFDLKKLLEDAVNGLGETVGLRQRPQPASTAKPISKPVQKPQSNFFTDTANNIGQGAKNLSDFSKTLTAGIQQGAGSVGDVALQAGSVVANPLAKLLNPNVAQYVDQATVDYTEPLRNNVHNLKDAEGKNIIGTTNVDQNASNIANGRGNVQDYSAVLGKGLEVANTATMLANPVSIARGLPVAQAVKLGAKDAALFGTTGGLQGGLQTYGTTGDLGQAVKQGATSALLSGATQGALDIAAPVIGSVIRNTPKVTTKLVNTAIDAVPTAQKLTDAHPEILQLKDMGTQLFEQRQGLINRGATEYSPAVRQIDTAIKNLGQEYNATYQRVMAQSKNQLQGGFIKLPGSDVNPQALNTTRLYRGLTQDYDPNYNINNTDAPTGYSTFTDNPELARQYAGDDGKVYYYDAPKNKLAKEIIDNDGERGLFLDNEKKAGLNGVSGKEYLVYNHHNDFNPKDIKELLSQRQSERGSIQLPGGKAPKQTQDLPIIGQNLNRDSGSITPPPAATAIPAVPKPKSDVSFVNTVKYSRNTTDRLAEGLTSRKGDVLSNEESLTNANKRINERGLEASIERAKTMNEGTTDVQAESLQLISELQKQGRHGDALDIVEATADRARKNGQATQILAAYNRLTPEGVVLSAQRAIKKAIKDNPEKNGHLKLSEEQAKKLYTVAKEAQEAAPDPKLSQAVIDTKAAIKGKTGTAKREAQRKYEAAQDAFDIAEDAQIIAQKKVQDELLKVTPSSNARKAILLWKAGLLTGIKGAFGGAAIGNATNAFLRTLRDVPASAIDTVLSKFTGNRTKAFTLKGLTSGFLDGADDALREFKTGANADDLVSKYDYDKVVFSDKPLGKAAQKYTDFVFGVYGAVDKPFKVSATKRSLFEQGKVEAINNKVPLSKRSEYVKDFVENPPTEALENAVNESLEATFQQKTGLGSALSGFKQAAWRQSEAVGATTEVLAPFTGIPSAVTSAIATYNPVGAVKTIYQGIKRASKGEFNPKAQKELVTALGNQLTGAGILWLGASLAKDNLMTLGYPSDPKERKLWESEGKTPYSINIGGQWRSLNYTGPLMVMLAAGGKYEQERAKGNDVVGSATAAALGIPKTVLESSPLSGIDKFLDAINTLETSDGDVSKAAERYVGNTISSTIPTLVGDIAKMGDDKIRETNSIIQQVQAKVPGLRNQLQAASDAFGNELKRRNSAVGTLIDPFKSSDITKLEGAEGEARRLQDVGKGILPTEAKDAEGSFKGQSREELNNINKRIGSTVIDEWDKVIQDPRYISLSDDDKKKVLDRANDTAYGVIKSEYTDVALNTRQKAYLAGEAVDYFDDIGKTDEEKLAAKEDKKATKKASTTKKKSGSKKGKYDYSKRLETATSQQQSTDGALRKLVYGSKIKAKVAKA